MAEWASQMTGWLRTEPLSSVISAHLGSAFNRIKTPGVPSYVPWARTTLSPGRNVRPTGRTLCIFVYLSSFAILAFQGVKAGILAY